MMLFSVAGMMLPQDSLFNRMVSFAIYSLCTSIVVTLLPSTKVQDDVSIEYSMS